MKVLVGVASRHGVTLEIARTIAEELGSLGLSAEVREAGAVDDLGGYDAVVLGSAVYTGNWLPEARRLVERQRDRLARLPVWLFSSRSLDAEDPQPHGDRSGVAEIEAMTRSRAHIVFAGRLDPHDLSWVERLIVRVVHALAGDFRDWTAIHAWAREIGAAVGVSGALDAPGAARSA